MKSVAGRHWSAGKRAILMFVVAVALVGVMAGSGGASPGDTTRVSVSSSGAQANPGPDEGFVHDVSISADGRFVAFTSPAPDLVAGDTNRMTDVFVHDRQTGSTERVSVSSSGAQANNNSGDPSISADGRYVAFFSYASNLVADDTNGSIDVFVHERANDTIPPDTALTSFPKKFTRSTIAKFRFSSPNPDAARFQCKLDASSYRACASPKSYSGLADGRHIFRARAVDGAGNLDPTPAIRTFKVDTVKPTGTISIKGGAATTSTRKVRLALSARDPSPASGVSVMRFRNTNTGTSWSAWRDYATSTRWLLNRGGGTKTVYVQYKDRAGNVSAAYRDTIKYNP